MPEVIFLDEPTTGLDPLARREFWDVLGEIRKDRFVVLTTHYMEEAEQLADTIGVLDEGRLIALGTMDELRKRVRYNYSVQILSLPGTAHYPYGGGDGKGTKRSPGDPDNRGRGLPHRFGPVPGGK